MAVGRFRTGCLLGTLLLAGCTRSIRSAAPTAATGSTSYRAGAGRDLAHYTLALGQVATGATPVVHPSPDYPPAMLASCPSEREIPARVIVDAAGHVAEVRIDPATDSAQGPFADAVRKAVRAWTFEPLQISRWAADAQGNSHAVDGGTRPFTLDYVFTFRCRQGQASVSGATRPAGR